MQLLFSFLIDRVLTCKKKKKLKVKLTTSVCTKNKKVSNITSQKKKKEANQTLRNEKVTKKAKFCGNVCRGGSFLGVRLASHRQKLHLSRTVVVRMKWRPSRPPNFTSTSPNSNKKKKRKRKKKNEWRKEKTRKATAPYSRAVSVGLFRKLPLGRVNWKRKMKWSVISQFERKKENPVYREKS